MNNLPKLESALYRLTKMLPNEPEVWFNLAEVKSGVGKTNDAIEALRHAIELSNARLAHDPKAHDLRAEAEKDPRFTPLKNLPEYRTLIGK
jgi:tetratricopeptide (TPR) repeat protein